MVRTLITGATGTLGTALRERLSETNHVVRATSRSPPNQAGKETEWATLDLVEGGGIESALAGVDIVIHAATAPQGEMQAVDIEGTNRLLRAAEDAGIDNFVYPSIVGIDEIPYSYYEHKRTAERAVEESAVPSTIVRATQFHSFVAELFGFARKLPVWPLPTKLQLQPVSVEEAGDVIVDHAMSGPSGRTDPVGGPRVHSAGELARAYREAYRLRRPILRLPLPGATAAAFRAGEATCPEYAAGTVTWEAWLDRQTENRGEETGVRDSTAKRQST